MFPIDVSPQSLCTSCLGLNRGPEKFWLYDVGVWRHCRRNQLESQQWESHDIEDLIEAPKRTGEYASNDGMLADCNVKRSSRKTTVHVSGTLEQSGFLKGSRLPSADVQEVGLRPRRHESGRCARLYDLLYMNESAVCCSEYESWSFCECFMNIVQVAENSRGTTWQTNVHIDLQRLHWRWLLIDNFPFFPSCSS